jgi:hypothetical protein
MYSIFTYIKDWILKFFKGAKLGLIGLQAYYHYPRLMIFPFMHGLFTTGLCLFLFSMVLASYGLISHFGKFSDYSGLTMKMLLIPGFIIGIFLACFTYVLFNVGICYATAAYCENKKRGFLSSVRMSLSKWKIILPWSALVILVKLFSGKKDQDASTADASLWQLATGTAWYLLTFSVYPIMAFENLSLFQTLKKSVHITKDNFGTISGMSFSIGVLNTFISYAAIGLAFGGLAIIRFISEYSMPDSTVITVSTMVTAVAYFLFVLFEAIAFMGMAETIMSTIVYRHMHNQPTGIFTYEQLEAIIQSTASATPDAP